MFQIKCVSWRRANGSRYRAISVSKIPFSLCFPLYSARAILGAVNRWHKWRASLLNDTFGDWTCFISSTVFRHVSSSSLHLITGSPTNGRLPVSDLH